jgi:hypothetical protein
MEGSRFDALTRELAPSGSRRRALAALFSGALGLVGARFHDAAAKNCKKIKNKKKRKACLAKARGCTPNCDRKICGDDGCGGDCGSCGSCADCVNGVCTPRANGTACGGSCKECQAGRCINKSDGTSCPEGENGRCRTGVCNTMPPCITFGNMGCTSSRNCCYQEPGEACPASPTCNVKSATGHRCRFDTDCESNVCVGYVCNSAG